MKKYILLTMIGTAAFLFYNFSSGTKSNPQEEVKAEKAVYSVPEDVQQVIDNSCYGCHNSESKNDKGKKKLQFDKLDGLKTYKLVGALTDIADVVHEGDMPPEKFLNKYPERNLTPEDKDKLINWASTLAKDMSSGE